MLSEKQIKAIEELFDMKFDGRDKFISNDRKELIINNGEIICCWKSNHFRGMKPKDFIALAKILEVNNE